MSGGSGQLTVDSGQQPGNPGLRDLMEAAWYTAQSKGFHEARAAWPEPAKQFSVLALIASEVGEAVEAVRHNDTSNYLEELADILIRVLDAAEDFNRTRPGTQPFISALLDKMAYNERRAQMHGDKLA